MALLKQTAVNDILVYNSWIAYSKFNKKMIDGTMFGTLYTKTQLSEEFMRCGQLPNWLNLVDRLYRLQCY